MKYPKAPRQYISSTPVPKKTSTIQDLLSSVKSALTSDTAASLAKGLGATALASAVGGSAGVSALGGITKGLNENREAKRLEDIRKTKDQLSMDRDQLNLDIDKEKLLKAQTDRIAGGADANKYGKITPWDVAIEPKPERGSGGFGSSSEKYGKITPYDVAVEPSKAGRGSRRSSSDSGVPPLPASSGVLTGPRSADPLESGQYSTDKKDVPLENRQKELIDGAEWGRKFVEDNGFANAGHAVFKKRAQDIMNALNASGLSKYQIDGARKEIARRMAPDFYTQERKRQDEHFSDDGSWAGGAWGKIKDSLQRYGPAAGGFVAGAKTGAMAGTAAPIFGHITPIVGGIVGGLTGAAAGYGVGDVIAEEQPDINDVFAMFSGQADAVTTPAIAGADKTADGKPQRGFSIITRNGTQTYDAADEGFTLRGQPGMSDPSVTDPNLIPAGVGEKPDNVSVDLSLYSERQDMAGVTDAIVNKLVTSGITTAESFMQNLPKIKQFPEVASLPESEQVKTLNAAFDTLTAMKPGRSLTEMPQYSNQRSLASARVPGGSVDDMQAAERQRRDQALSARLAGAMRRPEQQQPLQVFRRNLNQQNPLDGIMNPMLRRNR